MFNPGVLIMKIKTIVLASLLIAIILITSSSPVVMAAASETENNGLEKGAKVKWEQKYIEKVPPIYLVDPYLDMFGQARGPIPYTYEEVVKLAGHACPATSGAFTITRKALNALYPGDELPVRGQIQVWVPGAESQWNLGVFGEIITYITGAAPKTGFNGAEFGQVNNLYVRQNKMVYTELPTPTPPAQMVWIFERLDTGARVSVQYNLSLIQPATTPAWVELGKKMAQGLATPKETAEYVKYWNDRTRFVFENADTLEGFFIVTPLN